MRKSSLSCVQVFLCSPRSPPYTACAPSLSGHLCLRSPTPLQPLYEAADAPWKADVPVSPVVHRGDMEDPGISAIPVGRPRHPGMLTWVLTIPLCPHEGLHEGWSLPVLTLSFWPPEGLTSAPQVPSLLLPQESGGRERRLGDRG